MSRAVGLLLLVGVILAGCTASPAPRCEGPTCPPTPNGASGTDVLPTDDPPEPPINITVAKIAFEDCSGVNMAVPIPADSAANHVPAEFETEGAVPLTAGLVANAVNCPRAVTGNATIENVAMLWSYMDVVPKNNSWEAGGDSFYVYDVLVTNELLRAALVSAGVRSATLGLFMQDSKAGGSGVTMDVWQFSTDDIQYRLTFPADSGGSPVPINFDLHYWFGEGPFERVDVDHEHYTASVFSVDEGLLEVSGAGEFHEALGADAAPATGPVIHRLMWEIEAESTKFGT